MKNLISFCLCLLYLNCFSQRIEGYAFDKKLRDIHADNAQVEMKWDRKTHTYFRMAIQFDESTLRLEQKVGDDYIPISAPSIAFVISFLEFNGWEKTSINEDVENNQVTIFCKKKIKK